MKISVAIPVRNEAGLLGPLLEALLRQSHTPDEIVVADGGSTDDTASVAKGYVDRGVRVLELGPAYPGRGRNAAIRAAGSDWIALIDAGCMAEARWLENLLAFRAPLGSDVGVVFGEYMPVVASEWDAAQALAFVSPVDPSTGFHPPVIVSCLLHRAAWEMVGGFPEHLRAAEDLVFIDKLKSAGIPMVRSPGALVRWRLAPGPKAVFRRFRLYSAHHLAAGLFRTWHLRVMAMDAAALFLAVAGCFWLPALVPLAAGGVARVLRTVARRRANIEDGDAFRPDRLLRVAWLLLLADVATWAGALDYALGREPPR